MWPWSDLIDSSLISVIESEMGMVWPYRISCCQILYDTNWQMWCDMIWCDRIRYNMVRQILSSPHIIRHIVIFNMIRYTRRSDHMIRTDFMIFYHTIIYSWIQGCYTLICCDKIDIDRFLCSQWAEIDSEIDPHRGRTFISMPSGIVQAHNCSLGGRFPKSAFALWQVWINNCIFFLNSHWFFS